MYNKFYNDLMATGRYSETEANKIANELSYAYENKQYEE
jgi:hypothetical protein